MENMTWADARQRCQQLDGDLAVMESEAENDVIQRLIDGKTS